MTPEQARTHLEAGGEGPVVVDGVLDLQNTKLTTLPGGIRCYELNATGSRLESLPADLAVESRLILDHCHRLETLPEGLSAGAISLQDCHVLQALPEGLDTWFLDLSESRHFSQWPARATVGHGSVRLRNCISMAELPDWFGPLASLDLAGCVQLGRIPEGLRVAGWVDVGGTNLTGLPQSLDGVALRWRSVPVPARIAFEPESISAAEILAEANAEIRRVMIERMGYLRFAAEAQAEVLDQDRDPGGPRQLLRIELSDDEPLVGLHCSCPSTAREYFLRVPPDTKSCHQAAAWLAGFDDPEDYRPAIET